MKPYLKHNEPVYDRFSRHVLKTFFNLYEMPGGTYTKDLKDRMFYPVPFHASVMESRIHYSVCLRTAVND